MMREDENTLVITVDSDDRIGASLGERRIDHDGGEKYLLVCLPDGTPLPVRVSYDNPWTIFVDLPPGSTLWDMSPAAAALRDANALGCLDAAIAELERVSKATCGTGGELYPVPDDGLVDVALLARLRSIRASLSEKM